MNTGLLRVLIDPGRFFEDRMQDEPGLKMPALIVLIYAIISAVAAALTVNVIIDILPAEAQAFAVFGIAIVVIGALIMGFLTWIIVAGILHIISMLFKGEGPFTRTRLFTGDRFLPQVIGGIVGAAFSYRSISGRTFPVVTDPEQSIMVTEALAEMIAADPLTQIASLVGILFILWSANILIFGMKHARNLSTRDAVLTVGIPVALYIAYILITLLG